MNDDGVCSAAPSAGVGPDPDLQAKLNALREEGQQIWERFDLEVRRRAFHPFVAADYERVERALLPLRGPTLRFLEWGSATGVITIMADLLGFDACGIELDGELVGIARGLAARFGSRARFAHGSFLPTGYEWRSASGDRRLGTIGRGVSGYLELRHPLEDFDIVFAYPWGGEEPVMHDLMRAHGGGAALLLLHDTEGVQVYRQGRRVN
jgi:hypothetical protein